MPISQLNADGTVKIYNNKTGQMLDVRPEELGNYSPALVGAYQQIRMQKSNVEAGIFKPTDIPSDQQAAVGASLNATGYKPVTEEDKVANRKEAERLRAYEVLEKDVGNFEKNFKEAGLRGPLLSMIPTSALSPESTDFDAQREALAYSLAKAVGEQTGQGVSDSDIQRFLNKLPTRSDSDKQAALKINNIYQDLANRKGGDPLRSGMSKQEGSKFDYGSLGSGDIQTVKDLYGVAKDPGAALNAITSDPEAFVRNTASGLGEDIGGFINDPVGTVYRNPVQSALNLTGVGALLKQGGKTVAKGAAKSLPKIGGDGVGGAGGLLKEPNFMQLPAIEKAEKIAEFTSGGGPKDLIAKNVMLDEAKSMDKVLLEKNIYSAKTAKGKIEATNKALVDEGRSLQKTLSASPETIESTELGNLVKTHLEAQYGIDQGQSIGEIVNKISQSGKFDMATGNKPVDMLTLNKIKTDLMDYGPRALNIPERGPLLKDMSKEAAKVIREYMAKKVPEATPALRNYAALRTYLDDVLTDPSGLNIKGIDKLVNFLGDKVNFIGTYGAQQLYNRAASKLPKITAPEAAGSATLSAPASALPAITPSVPLNPARAPLDAHIIEGMIKGKGPAQGERLIRDMRYKQGEPQFRGEQEKVLRQSSKKRYK